MAGRHRYNRDVRALLISTYDMGRQPFGLASPAAWLQEAGVDVHCLDLAKQRLDDESVLNSDVVAFFLPMHTATRLALPVIDRVRALHPPARLVAYGLYAALNEAMLRERGVAHVLGGEFEADLVAVMRGSGAGSAPRSLQTIPRLSFKVPVRDGLLPLAKYATLQIGADRRTVGYTEASRGCKHRCRHCPIVPVYDGRFRVVAPDVVLADVRAQVAAGARHITFGDPDFFNGPRHAESVVRALAAEWPDLTYDATIKVEHLLRHAELLPVLRETGCAFVTSAVESLDDGVLAKLEKGHTRADFERAVGVCREAGLALVPTFVAFTPWTTASSYLDLLYTLDRLELVESVAPIQLAIRLLVPQGSRMLELPEMRERIGPFDATTLTHPWTHADPAVDALQAAVARQVGVGLNASRRDVFARVWETAHAHAAADAPARREAPPSRATIPYLNEPWYC